jgi:pSer/pThr/pTyr-binding forkhead associated (FHA) protein
VVDELCPRCGWVLGASVAACPACGARLTRTGSGFETVYFPEAAAAGADGASNQPSSSTSLLHESEPTAGPQGVELKLQPLLVQRGGSQSGQRLQVSCPSTTVGRGEGEIRIDDPALSGRHFKIEECGHRFFLRDLESTNGTFLNGHLVRSAPLKSGDEIRAGESVFVFSILEVIACD